MPASIEDRGATVIGHLTDFLLRHSGIDPAEACDIQRIRARNAAAALAPHLLVFREMVEAGEMHGWDNQPVAAGMRTLIDRAREAHAALTGFDNTKPDTI
jgi:hypothetical protein